MGSSIDLPTVVLLSLLLFDRHGWIRCWLLESVIRMILILAGAQEIVVAIKLGLGEIDEV